jgi:hypothetical protein
MTAPGNPKKGFKFQPWMGGAVVVPFGLFMIVRGILLTGSVDLGGECRNRDECKAPADSCLMTNAKSVCSKVCTGASDCPGGLSCKKINVSMNTGSGVVDLPNMQYCLP